MDCDRAVFFVFSLYSDLLSHSKDVKDDSRNLLVAQEHEAGGDDGLHDLGV